MVGTMARLRFLEQEMKWLFIYRFESPEVHIILKKQDVSCTGTK